MHRAYPKNKMARAFAWERALKSRTRECLRDPGRTSALAAIDVAIAGGLQASLAQIITESRLLA
jgi:hypothetical protein